MMNLLLQVRTLHKARLFLHVAVINMWILGLLAGLACDCCVRAIQAIIKGVFELTLSTLLFAGVLGATIGSFANVVIFRLPEGRSVVFPRSSCPHCGYTLQPLDLVPIGSWLALRGKCRNCRAPISVRYPAIEALMALGYMVLAWRFPLLEYGATVLVLWLLYTLLVIMSMIDVDHYILPDSLTLPAVAVGLAGTALYAPTAQLPTLSEATFGAAFAAGILALINRVGSLALRRFADTQERLYPIGMDQVNVAAVAGVWGGLWVGITAAVVSLALNLLTRKTQRISEPILYMLWLVGLVVLPFHPLITWQAGLFGMLAAAGAVAVLGAAFWWGMELTGRVPPVGEGTIDQDYTSQDNSSRDNKDKDTIGHQGAIDHAIDHGETNIATATEHTASTATVADSIGTAIPLGTTDTAAVSSNQAVSSVKENKNGNNNIEDNASVESIGNNAYDEPIAMGFGDVKLAAVLGTFLGWQLSLVALFLSFLVGAVGGIISRLGSGAKLVPFGPYLALAGMLSLFFGRGLIPWYLGLLGF